MTDTSEAKSEVGGPVADAEEMATESEGILTAFPLPLSISPTLLSDESDVPLLHFSPLFRQECSPHLSFLYSERDRLASSVRESRLRVQVARVHLELALVHLELALNRLEEAEGEDRELLRQLEEVTIETRGAEMEQPCRFNSMLEQLRMFKEVCGHVDVPVVEEKRPKRKKGRGLTPRDCEWEEEVEKEEEEDSDSDSDSDGDVDGADWGIDLRKLSRFAA